MSFEDFLDMVSAFSEQAPTDFKAMWAFKIYGTSKNIPKINCLCHLTIIHFPEDFNNNHSIDQEDIENLITKLAGERIAEEDVQIFSKKVIVPLFIIKL